MMLVALIARRLTTSSMLKVNPHRSHLVSGRGERALKLKAVGSFILAGRVSTFPLLLFRSAPAPRSRPASRRVVADRFPAKATNPPLPKIESGSPAALHAVGPPHGQSRSPI
jgi:hypothetical protein